jgi:hypothetical protein
VKMRMGSGSHCGRSSLDWPAGTTCTTSKSVVRTSLSQKIETSSLDKIAGKRWHLNSIFCKLGFFRGFFSQRWQLFLRKEKKGTRSTNVPYKERTYTVPLSTIYCTIKAKSDGNIFVAAAGLLYFLYLHYINQWVECGAAPF